MNSVNLFPTTNRIISGSADLSTPPVDPTLAEKIVSIAGGQLHPLHVENPKPGHSYFVIEVPTTEFLHLYDLHPDVLLHIASYLPLKDLKSLGRALRPFKNYQVFMTALKKTYFIFLKPRILPLTNQGTLVHSGGTTGRVFFKGFDQVGIWPTKPRKVFDSYEIPSLANCTIKSVSRCTSDDWSKTNTYYLVVHTEEEDVYVFYPDNKSQSHLPFEKINKSPVKQVICKQKLFYLRTEEGLYRYERDLVEDTWNIKYYHHRNLDNMDQIGIYDEYILVKYKDGTGKLLNKSFKQESDFSSGEKLWQCTDCVFLSGNNTFYKFAKAGYREFLSMRGKKITAVSPTGRFVCTEKNGWWMRVDHDYRPLGDFSQALEIDGLSSLLLSNGKLYYIGGGISRKLVSDNPQEVYAVPTECIRTQGYSIKNIWGNGTNIWFEADDGVYQLCPDEELRAKSFDKAPVLQFRGLSTIAITGKILHTWNQICIQHKYIFTEELELKKPEEGASLDKINRHSIRSNELIIKFESEREKQFAHVRDLIVSCTKLNELKKKIKTITDPFAEVLSFLDFLNKEK